MQVEAAHIQRRNSWSLKTDKTLNRKKYWPGVLQVYSQTAHVAKYLAVSLKFAELNPGVKMYHILMQVGWRDVRVMLGVMGYE